MTAVLTAPRNEARRLAALNRYALLDTPSEPDFDDLAELAALICGTPIALVSFVDGKRQWFKSRHGLEAAETSRDVAFCAHAIESNGVFIVPDALADERFANNPLVTSAPAIRFYAGAPLITSDGEALGTLCVIDSEPRELSIERQKALEALARQTVAQMELRLQTRELQQAVSDREQSQRARDALEAQLLHTLRLQSIGTLAAGLAHEIDGPKQVLAENLSFIERTTQGLLDLVRQPAGEASDAAVLAERVERADLPFLEGQLPRAFTRCDDAVARIERLIESVQRFSGAPGEMSNTDLNQCLRDTLDVCQNEYKFVADIVTDFGDLPPVLANGGDMNQVFQSLIVNAAQAIQYTGRRGRIMVRSTVSGDAAVIRIEDNGCGIEESIRDRVFDPFFTTHEHRHAAGQGLSIAHSIVVNRHGGSMKFESVTGLGTRFTVRLPLSGAAVDDRNGDFE